MSNYLDFGVPISFGWTAQYLDRKTCTRRNWKDSHVAKFIAAYDRAVAAGKQLRVPAIDKAYHAGGRQIGWCILSLRPYKSHLSEMVYGDLVAEGGMCRSVDQFINKYFGGNGATEVWVINFIFVPLPDLQIEYTPLLDRELYADIEARVLACEGVPASELISDDEDDDDVPKTPIQSCCICGLSQKKLSRDFDFDPKYDANNYDRKAVVRRYLDLVNSPTYAVNYSIDRFAKHTLEEESQRGPRPKSSPEKLLLPPEPNRRRQKNFASHT